MNLRVLIWISNNCRLILFRKERSNLEEVQQSLSIVHAENIFEDNIHSYNCFIVTDQINP